MFQLKHHQDKKNYENLKKCDLVSTNEHEIDILTELDSSDVQINENLSHSYKYSKQNDNTTIDKTEVNATEFLISSKRNLELQLTDLQSKNTELENTLVTTTNKCDFFLKKVNTLENELKNICYKYNAAIEELQAKDILLKEFNDWKTSVLEEKTDLQEQLEFTKTILTAKEAENDSLHSQLFNIQSQLDTTQLQLQQLTTGAHDTGNQQVQESIRHNNETLLQKVTSLEQQLKSQLKDYQQINSHYEHYVGELNEQLKAVTSKNEDLNRELQNLSNRENGLIEQISEMEIRIQNYNRTAIEKTAGKIDNTCDIEDFKQMQEKYEKCLVSS